MAFANFLSQQGHEPEEIRTVATASLEDGRIQRMRLETTGRVDGLDAESFARLAVEADQKCPVSNSYRNCIEITVTGTLL
jgi:osmotically inducible protein OsmC